MVLRIRFKLIFSIFLLSFTKVHCGGKNNYKVKNPCTATRHIKSNLPTIRVVDEINDEPGVILGQAGLQYYTLISSRIQREVVIECSSSYAQVKWIYKGVGASTGFKVVNTRWTGTDINRAPSCFSSALVIAHVTDQLTGEYKCQEINSTRAKGPRRNSFKLFVPSTPATYPPEGSEVNITVSSIQEKASKPLIVIPCISKKTSGEVKLFRAMDGIGEAEPAEYKNMQYDPFSGFVIPQVSIQFNGSRILRHECRFANLTLLRVNLIMESEEKIAPEKEVVKSSSPYLSWTTKTNPKLKFSPDVAPSNVLIWQQFFTKKSYEEISQNAPMFYLGSATLMNLTYGREGNVTLYAGDKSEEAGLIYKWKYFILDSVAEQSAGLKYDDFEFFHVFICKSASASKPEITFNSFSDSGEALNVTGQYNVTDCHLGRMFGNVGCVMLTSYANRGEVKCIGDGVDETIKYPPQPFEAGRPFFVERGNTLEVSISPETEKLRIPCLANSEVPTSVFLYRKTENGYKKIWAEDDEEFGDNGIEFFPSSGFYLTRSNSEENQEFFGEYLCSSSIDPNDRTDSVLVTVQKEIGTNYKISPTEKHVFGRIPFKVSWEGDEELEITSDETLRNISLGREENNPIYGFGAKFVLMENTNEGESRKLHLKRKSDGLILHSWTFHQIARDSDHRAGLHIDQEEDNKGETFTIITCKSKTAKRPVIRYYHCQNEDTCGLMRKCHEKECSNPSFYHEDVTNSSLIRKCDSEEGCSGIAIRSIFLNGILNVSCSGDGVNEFQVLKDVFFKDDIVWDTEENQEDGFIYLSTSHAVHAADQNPQREIQYIGSNIEWELGETVDFNCAASPYLFSNGIKWAVQTKSGDMIFYKDSIFDIQFKYISSTQVASSFSLLIDNPEYSRIYCFVPLLDSTKEWRNVSMPIFVRPETSDEYCDEKNSIHLINIYPSPSKLNLNFNETRLNKLKYFVVPENVLQFAVKISGPKPFTWNFNGMGDGPSRTPLIQSDRQILDFYDSSTYCHSSRLLINLRHKNSNDTGRYVVKHKYESNEVASFYIFVPSKYPPFLLRFGGQINVTIQNDDDEQRFYIPCLANSPNVKVELFPIYSENKNETTEVPLTYPYDPTKGFLVTESGVNSSTSLRTYKCMVNRNATDSVVVFVNPAKRIPELKYEKVNDFHVFTCKSGSPQPPEITLTEIARDGMPVENSTQFKTRSCSSGCIALITRVHQGSVSCVGDGIDETYRFPPTYNGNQRTSDKSVGLWYDNSTNTFKCQMNSVDPPTLAAVTCRRPNECEIMKRLLQGRGDDSQATSSQCGDGCAELKVNLREMPYTAPNWFSVFLRCKGEDNMEIMSQYFYDKGIMTYASIENAEGLKKIRIDVTAFRKQGSNLYATFRCFANRYFYSRGLQWGLEGKNGILEFPETAATQIEVQSFSAIMSTINLEINEYQHNAVYCFVPLIDSRAWANSTLKFPIEQLRINI